MVVVNPDQTLGSNICVAKHAQSTFLVLFPLLKVSLSNKIRSKKKPERK